MGGRKTCGNGHRTEDYGLIMANHYSHQSKSEYLCVDWSRSVHIRSSNADHNGALLYTTEMQTSGHSSGDETQYGHDRELSCCVCSPTGANTAVYTRWGSRTCPSGTTTLYSNGNQNGALLYGTEYENTGAVDKNHNGDAACAVCQSKKAATVYVQWGRTTCSNGHKLEYYGLIMANHYSHQGKSMYLCVDWSRSVHIRSSNADHNGALLYTTEMQTSGHSSGDEAQYGHDRELSCVVCSTSRSAVYTRWGSRSCPTGANELYEGFVANDYHQHRGSGY